MEQSGGQLAFYGGQLAFIVVTVNKKHITHSKHITHKAAAPCCLVVTQARGQGSPAALPCDGGYPPLQLIGKWGLRQGRWVAASLQCCALLAGLAV